MTVGCDPVVSRDVAIAVSGELLNRLREAAMEPLVNTYEPPARINSLENARTLLLRLNVAGKAIALGGMTESEIARAAKVPLFQVMALFGGRSPGTRGAEKLMVWCGLDADTLLKHAIYIDQLNHAADEAAGQIEERAAHLRATVCDTVCRLTSKGKAA